MPESLKVLLVRLSALGDVVQCLPALAGLRHALPEAEIAWLVEDRHASLLDGHPHIDRLFVFHRKRLAGSRVATLKTLRRELCAFGPDVAIDLQGNLKGGFLTRLSGAPRRIGLSAGEAREGAHLFATERVAAGSATEHRADRALRLVAPLGVPLTPRPEAAAPHVREAAAESIAERLTGIVEETPYAVLVPGTSEFGRFKRWQTARFGELAGRLSDRGLIPLVSHGPGERELAEDVVRQSGGTAQLAPDTHDLHELLALLRGATLVVGADSGPVVMASALGRPTVALLGPKDPRIYAPPGPRTHVVWKGVYCSPCTLRTCGDPICMSTLSVDEVWPTVERALAPE